MAKSLLSTIRLADIKIMKCDIGLSCIYERDLTYSISVGILYITSLVIEILVLISINLTLQFLVS